MIHFLPASANPRKKRATIRPAKFSTRPISVMIVPQLMMIPVKKTLGVNLFSMTLVTGSANAYEMKNMVRVWLYLWPPTMLRSGSRPAALALPA